MEGVLKTSYSTIFMWHLTTTGFHRVRPLAFYCNFAGSILNLVPMYRSIMRRSWVSCGYSGFLPLGKLTGWVRVVWTDGNWHVALW